MIYELKHNNILLKVDSSGAEAICLIYKDIHILRSKDEIWGRTAPLLFPNVGCLKDNYTIIEGKKYPLTKHGFLRDSEFDLFYKDESSITLVNKCNDKTLSMFPFKYEAYVTYTISEKKVKTAIKIKNVDEVSFKYNIGGHPGFNCPFYKDESFNDYKIIFEEEETFDSPSYCDGLWDFDNPFVSFKKIKDIKLDYKYFMIDAFFIKNIKSKKVSLLNKEGKGINFYFEGFNTLAFWTKPNAKYLCLEPWCGYDDLIESDHIFNKKDDLIEIKPGEEKEVSYCIEAQFD